MKPVVKGLLIGCVALIALAATAVIWGVQYLKANKGRFMAQADQVRKEAQQFGRSVSEPACVTEAMRQYRADQTLTGRVRIRLWLTACLESSSAESSFCSGVPPKDEIARTVAWRLGECSRLGFEGDSDCANILTSVQDYCNSSARAAKAPVRR